MWRILGDFPPKLAVRHAATCLGNGGLAQRYKAEPVAPMALQQTHQEPPHPQAIPPRYIVLTLLPAGILAPPSKATYRLLARPKESDT